MTSIGAIARVRAALPEGRTLAPDQWQRRHALLLGLLWAHAAALPIYSFAAQGYSPLHDLVHGLPLIAFALLGRLASDRRVKSCAVALGLLTASASIVHISGGMIEAHFHFFVMLAVLALYEDWLPFGLATVYVLLHHAVVGIIAPGAVYDHAGNPVWLAFVHGGFVLAAGAANVLTWRINESSREETRRAHAELETQYEVTRVLSGAVSLDDAAPQLLAAIGRRQGWDAGLLWICDDDGAFLQVRYVWTPDRSKRLKLHVFARHCRLRRGEALAGRAWSTGQPAWTDAVTTLHRDAAGTDQRSGIAVPLIANGEVLGVLGFSTPDERPAEARTIEQLSMLSDVLAMFMDRLERSRLVSVLEDVAHTDPLTGVANRRTWNARLDLEAGRGRRRTDELCIALVDLDDFKTFNDTGGHLAGDRLLVEWVSAWRACLRDDDLLARLGGDEFGLILPACPEAEATEIAARLQAAMPAGQTCSVGVAAWDGTEDPLELVDRADRALYGAKHLRAADAPV